MKKLINEAKRMQQLAGILKESIDPETFLDYVFNELNDKMRAGEISEDDFNSCTEYMDTHKDEILNFNKGLSSEMEEVEQAVDHLIGTILK